MRQRTVQRCARHGTFLAMAMAVGMGAHAQLADLAQVRPPAADRVHPHDGGKGDLDALLHKYEERIEFTENKGQLNAAVLFKADFPLGQALATREGMLMKAYDPAAVKARQEEGMRIEQEMHDGKPGRPLLWNEKGHGWMLQFQNALPTMRIESKDAHAEASNYFLGGKQALGVHTYQEVWYTGVYRGIDVRYYPAKDGSLEYDIVCAPNSDPRAISIAFKGIERLRVNEKGELVVPTSLGDMTYPAPVVYQRTGGREQAVKASYRVSGSNVLGFTLGAYDKNLPLVIDPIAMRWSTWVNTNSSGDNHGHAIWVDPSDGAIYMVARVVGTTDNITVGAFDVTANGNLETIVGKYLEPSNVGDAGTRVWQTYIGGSGDDNPYAMEQGPDGNLYITGQTSSTNFPLLGGSAFSGSSINQQAQTDIDVFVLKITPDGQSIKAAVVGGNGADDNYDVRTAPNGDVFVCGSTTSTNLLTLNAGSGASNTNAGGTDALVFRINQDLSSLVWMRNYGGSSADRASIMLHNPVSGDLFVGGNTSSTNFPTTSPRQSVRGGSSAGFLQRLTGAGGTTWSSYFSSAASQSASLLCMEFNVNRDQLVFGGVTSGLDATNISGAYDASVNGNNDFYVARMGIDQTFLSGTYVGGSSNEVNMMGLNTDLNNDVFVFGYTNSTNFPVSASPNVPLQATNQGSNDKVFFKLKFDLANLLFSTYYGGTADDYDPVGERGIKFNDCRIYTIVTAQSNNIPLTQGALNTTKISTTSRYEPGLVVWANPPDLLGNSITYLGTAICAGSIPGDIQGSQPTYVLPTIVRNNTTSAYPAFPAAATFQWQISTDSVNWTNIAGSTGQNLTGAEIGVLTQKTFIRRVIGGDACILAGAADQVVTVRIMSVNGEVTDATCNGGSTGSITATADGTAPFGYAWSNGQTGQTATGLVAGSYSVTVTDANGCEASNTFQVGQPTAVGGNADVTDATCGDSNGSATASGSGGTPGYSYAWSTGAVGATLSNVPAGGYSVTISDANQCAVELPVTIGGSGLPGANAGNDAEITCANDGQVVLHGTSPTQGVTFSWSGPGIVSGGGTADVTVNAAGTYTLTVFNPQTGCSSTDQAGVTLNNGTPGAQASGGTLTCEVLSVQLTGTGNGEFSWSGPNNYTSTEQNPTVNVAGTYVLTVTGANGCSSTANAEVGTDNEGPGAQAQGGTLTCTTLSIQLTGSGNGDFAWTGPNNYTSTEQNPTVSVAGTYVLTVTGTNGCTSQDEAVVELDNDVPGAQATGGTLTCTTQSVQLNGSGNGDFSWTGPNNYTSTEQNPTVSVAGTYVLTVTGANGCTSQDEAVVELDNGVPGAQAAGGTLTCTTLSVQMTGSGNGDFSWTGPNNYTSTEQNPTVSVAGTYMLTVTGANGCTSQDEAVVELDNDVPGAQATGGTLTCTTMSVQLTGSGNGDFGWTGPNNYTSTEQNPTVSVAGTYVLTVTGANGCTSQAEAVVELDNEAPGAQAQGGVLTCSQTSVTLLGSGNGDFSWTGPNNYTSDQQNPVVGSAGTYVLTVTGANGCTSQDEAVVELDNDVPGAQATGGTLTCTTQSVQLNGSGNGDFSWTGPNNYTSTEQNPTVSVAGTYVLTVTGANGCTSQDEAVVELDNDVPGAQATGGTLTCTTLSVQLTGSGNGDFAWTGPNNYTSTEQNPTVSEAGTYVLTVTGANGCTSQDEAVVELDNEAPGAQAQGGVLTCSQTSVTLLGTGNPGSGPGAGFSWTGPNNYTSDQQNPVVGSAGTYVLTVTGANGCTSQDEAVVEQDANVPGAQAVGGTLTCTTLSVQLSGNGNGDFAWTGPNNYTSTEQNPTVSVAGTYVLTVTGGNGCTSQAEAVVELDNEVPGAQAVGGTLTCALQSLNLSGSGNGDFSWTGPNNYTSTERNPTVSVAGTYVLTVTGANGCTSQDEAVVELDNAVPGAQATGGTLTCTTLSVQLSGSGNGDFSWAGPNNYTSTEQNPTVSVAGTYVLTVTGGNGCTSQIEAVVELDNEAPGAQAQGGTLTCGQTSVTLLGSGNGDFSWTGPNNYTSGQQNPVVGAAGTYVLTVTGANGCTSQDEAVVEQDANVPGAQAVGGTLTCTTLSVQLSGNGNGDFAWTGPNNYTSTEQNPTVSVAGTYVLTVTGGNGCTSQAEAVVELDNEVPGAQAVGGTLTCAVQSLSLSGSGNGDFSWTGPNNYTSTEQNPTVSVAGTYVLTVTGANGCTSQDEAVVELDNAVPGAQATGGTLTCTTLSVQLTGSGNGDFAWTGPNNYTITEQNPTVSVAGTYVLTVTGANGCTSQIEAVVQLDNEAPGAQAQGGTLTCGQTSVTLLGTGNGDFSWTGPNNYTSDQQNPVVGAAGTYVLTVTGANGCTSQDEAVVEQDANVPGAQAVGGTLTCTTLSVQLSGSGNGDFAWTGPNNYTSTEQNPTVLVAGTYVLTVTGANGCTSQAEAVVDQDNNEPGAQAGGGVLTCTNGSVQLSGSGSGDFAWTGPNNYTSTEQNPTVTQPGVYVLTVTGVNGCTSVAQTEVGEDRTPPVAIAYGGTIGCDQTSTQLTGIGTGDLSWTGPSNFTSTEANPTVSALGLYVLTVVGENGCIGTATAEVLGGGGPLEVTTQGGIVPCSGTGVLISASADGEVSYSWTGPDNFTGTGAQVPVYTEGIYTVTAVADGGCSATVDVVVGKEDCNSDCGPIITYCPQPMTVECGTDLNPDLIGYPAYRKDKNCPAIVYASYADVTSGYCPRTVTRTWTMTDETGATEYCTQVFIIVDTQAPVLHGVPENITVECGAVPGKDDAVWAEDGCQASVDVYITDAYEETDGKSKCDYVIVRTYWAMDYCGNLASSTQTIHVFDTTAPTLACEFEPELKADCKELPEPTKCEAHDACDADVAVTVTDEYVFDEAQKQCFLYRTYTATDDCGNATSAVQTIWLTGACCDKSTADKVMEVTVTPNPFRESCVIAFEVLEEGTATVAIFDLNGRPVKNITVTGVTKGQQVRVPFSADAVEMGVYQYRVMIGSRTAAGRMIVQ